MIVDDFIVETKIGLYCAKGGFYLDPKENVKEAVISHAHGDHACSGNVNVHCTEATSQFMSYRYKAFAAMAFHLHSYQQPFILNGVRITFIPAGHILGSAQVLMEFEDTRYLYTGDYKLQPDVTCEPIEFVKADVLITESTFANPLTQHPPAEQEILKLKSTTSHIMLGAYTLGKSQRLIKLISEYLPEKRLLVHHSILPFIRIYEQNGINLGCYEHYDRKLMKANFGNVIYLVPPMVYASNIKALNVVKVFASGWGNLQKNNGLKLYLSDHADWNDILTTVDHVEPREIWTTHGNGTELKSHLEGRILVKLLN
jgi:putative mRNA 3-end processing factor